MGVATRIDYAAHGLPTTRAALDYASELHRGQLRQVDGAPFIVHLREVASLLCDAGAADHLIAAGALHDVIEKTSARAVDLRERFGERIATLVLAVSEDERIAGYAARKAALRAQVADAGEEALMLFAADKISKARELSLHAVGVHAELGHAGSDSRKRGRKVEHYRRCLALLQERLPDSPLVAQFAAELEKLSSEAHRRSLAGDTP